MNSRKFAKEEHPDAMGQFLQSKYQSQFLSSNTSEESPRWQQPNPIGQANGSASQSLSMHLSSLSAQNGVSSEQQKFPAEVDTIYSNRFLDQVVSTDRTSKTVRATQPAAIRTYHEKVNQLQDAMSTVKITSIDQTMATFVERLYMRQHLQEVSGTLSQVESMLLTLASEDPVFAQVYRSIIQRHSLLSLDHQTFGGTRTHVQALRQVEQLALTIENSFREFMNFRQQCKSQEHFSRENQMLLLSDVEPSSIDSNDQPYADSFCGNRLRAITTSNATRNTHQRVSSSLDAVHPFHHELHDNDMQPAEKRTDVKNDLIDKLRAENQKLEIAVIEQQNQINILNCQLNESHPKLSQIDRKEIESIVNRLRLDLEQTKLGRKEQELKLLESEQVISQLNGQIRELKTRLSMRDDLAGNEMHALVSQRTKELDDMRKENTIMAKRYQELAQMLKQKEIELIQMEDRSKTLLQNAQKEAEECITYFKGIAFQKSQEFEPTRNKSHSREREQLSLSQVSNPLEPRSFPKSLAPVTSRPLLNNTQAFPLSPKPLRRSASQVSAGGSCEEPRSVSPKASPSIYKRKPVVETHHLGQLKLEACINSLSLAFQEIAETKAGLSALTEACQSCFSDQLEKFSVLAYDYVERLSAISTRETKLQEQMQEQKIRVEKLKSVSQEQAEVITNQKELIENLKKGLWQRHEAWDRVCSLKETERQRLIKLCNDELPVVGHSLQLNAQNIDTVISLKIKNSQELQDMRQANELLKTKVRVLESELEKTLQRCKQTEDQHLSEKRKGDRLTDLIKDIWMAEVQKGMSQFVTMASNNNGNSSSRPHSRAVQQSEPYLMPDVPMPISWLSDIADCIKQLKEMNDIQRDDVYQLYLNLCQKDTANPVNHSVSDSSRFDQQEQLSSDDVYKISENEAESTENKNSNLRADEGESSERISDRNTKMMQRTVDDKRDMSFSRQHSVGDLSASYSKRNAHLKSDQAKPMNSTFNKTKTKLVQEQRSLSYERHKTPTVISKTRNHSANVTKDKSTARVRTCRVERPTYFATEISPRVFNRGAKSGTSQVGEVRCRNELFAMLHEEVAKVMRQVKVGKETIIQMERLIRKKERTIGDLHTELNTIAEQSHSFETQLRSCENVLQVRVQQNEELQLIIEDKDDAIETLKSQVEDFERELLGLQEQISQVMKLNTEISAASEHWEKSYHDVVAQNQETLAIHENDYKSMQKQLSDRIHQFKRKLGNKDNQLKDMSGQLEEIKAYLEELNQVKLGAMSVATNTGPEMELLEKQNCVLKDQLTQVKDDIAAVLDQYESEQVNNKSLSNLLHSERANNDQLGNELNRIKNENEQLCQHIEQLQTQLDQESEYFRQQMQHAADINEQLQQQVEAVTQLTEELQDQISLTSRSNNELVHRSEKVENQRRVLEYRLKTYVKQIAESNDMIQELQSKLDRLRSAKRESRSYSFTRATRNMQGVSHTLSNEKSPLQLHSSASSASLTRAPKIKPQEMLLQTTSSIFDAEVDAMATDTVRLAEKRKSSKKAIPSKQTQVRRRRADRSVSPLAQDVSTHTGTTGITGFANAHQTSTISACVCQKQTKPQTEKALQTEESSMYFTEASTFRGPDAKNKAEAVTYAKKKVRKLLKMVEDLVRHYCTLAQEKNDHRMLAQGKFLNCDANSSVMSTDQELNDLQVQLQKWTTLTSEQLSHTDKKLKKDRAVQDAKSYFDRKSPSLVACLNILALNYNPNPAPSVLDQPIKQTKSKRFETKTQRVTTYQRGEVDLQQRTGRYVETDGEQSAQANRSANSSNLHSRGNSIGRSALNNHFRVKNQRESRSSSLNANNDAINIISIATSNEVKSPSSMAQPVTCTFRDHGQLQELQQQNKLLYKKLTHLGRNLAGICFGGCIFMSHQIPETTKSQVDQALQFLAVDNSAQDQIVRLDETSKVIEGLLNLMQHMFTLSCRNSLKSDHAPKPSYNSLDFSHHQCSLNHDMVPGLRTESAFQLSSYHQTSALLQGQIRERLLELESKLKTKASQIGQLEATLDNLLNPKQHQLAENQSFELLCQEPASLRQLLQNLKRAMSKLKIELHADYLSLGQINISGSTPREPQLDQPPTTREAFNSVGSFAPSGYLASTVQIHPNQSTDLGNFSQIFAHIDPNYPQMASQGSNSSRDPTLKFAEGSNQPLLQSIGGMSADNWRLHRHGSASTTKTQVKNAAIDRIVEELKGLTFEL